MILGPKAPASARSALGAAAFIILLWFCATFFLLGDLGRWSDDWYFPQRDIQTGAITGWTYDAGAFVRPLHFTFTPALTTALYHDWWAVQLIGALLHGAAALLVWRLVRALGCAPFAAHAAALLFLVFPAAWEVSLWASAFATGIATSLMILLLLAQIRISRSPRSWWLVALTPLLAFASASFNEQPAGALLALPLIALAARPRAERSRAWFVRALAPTALCAGACALYIALMLATTTPGARGSLSTFITPAQLPDRIALYAKSFLDWLLLRDFKNDAFARGTAHLRDVAPFAIVMGLALAGAGALWIRHWVRQGARRAEEPASGAEASGPAAPPARADRAMRPLWILAAGVVATIGAWLPVMVIEAYSYMNSRLLYAPLIGVALLVALVIDRAEPLLNRALRGSRPLIANCARAAPAAAIAAFAIYCVIPMIGMQAARRDRWHADLALGSQLRAQLPAPEPGTFFWPLRIDLPPRRNYHYHEIHMQAVVRPSWAAGPWIRSVYPGVDVCAGWAWGFGPVAPPIAEASARGLLHWRPPRGRFPEAEGRPGWVWIPWNRIVPFVTEPDHTLRIVSEIVIVGDDGAEIARIRPAQVARAIAAGAAEPHTERIGRDARPR